MRLKLTIATLFLLPLVALVQNAPTAEQMKATAKKFKSWRHFEVKYDKFKDRTSVKAGPFSTDTSFRSLDSGPGVTASFIFKGDSLSESVDAYLLTFALTSRRWRFLNDPELYIIADGERLFTGTALHDGRVNYNSVSEVVTVEVSGEVFRKVANARAVEMKMGSNEFKLKDKPLRAFRDLVSLAEGR